MGFVDWLLGRDRSERSTGIVPLSFNDYLQWFAYQGLQYPFMPGSSMSGTKQEEPEASFPGYVQGAYRSNGVVFACMLARLMVFSEARFQFRQRRNGRAGDLFGTEALAPLERPWGNATTGDLLTRALQDADLGGNFYAARRGRGLLRMRPDWVTIVLGSQLGPDDPSIQLDAEVIGYVYQPGGPSGTGKPVVLFPEEVAHFAPIPDPLARFRGMSWLTPVLREIMGDQAATEHKLQWFEGGATENFAVTYDPSVTPDAAERYTKLFKEKHPSFVQMYETMFLGGGASITTVGSDMRESAFKEVQGAGETRIAAAAGVPPVIVGLSEGLEAATYSNYGQARRRFADGTVRPLWRNISGSLATVIDVPSGAELWYDDRDIPFLQEDVKDAADIIESQARSIRTLTDGGYDADSVVDSVMSGDLTRLKHTGLLPVQVQKPGTNGSSNGNGSQPDEEPAVA